MMVAADQLAPARFRPARWMVFRPAAARQVKELLACRRDDAFDVISLQSAVACAGTRIKACAALRCDGDAGVWRLLYRIGEPAMTTKLFEPRTPLGFTSTNW